MDQAKRLRRHGARADDFAERDQRFQRFRHDGGGVLHSRLHDFLHPVDGSAGVDVTCPPKNACCMSHRMLVRRLVTSPMTPYALTRFVHILVAVLGMGGITAATILARHPSGLSPI